MTPTTTLFDTHPKSDPKYLFGRERELDDLAAHVKNHQWVVILGPRRVGKTSLARCAASKLGLKTVVIDSRVESDYVASLAGGLAETKATTLQAGAAVPHALLSHGLVREVFIHPVAREDPCRREEGRHGHRGRSAVAEEPQEGGHVAGRRIHPVSPLPNR